MRPRTLSDSPRRGATVRLILTRARDIIQNMFYVNAAMVVIDRLRAVRVRLVLLYLNSCERKGLYLPFAAVDPRFHGTERMMGWLPRLGLTLTLTCCVSPTWALAVHGARISSPTRPLLTSFTVPRICAVRASAVGADETRNGVNLNREVRVMGKRL